jgi:polar amino acid transport system substrate-binding protein
MRNIVLAQYPIMSFYWWRIALVFISCCQVLGINAKHLDVAVGWSKPPYVITSGNTGYELDLVSNVLKSMGHDMSPLYVPFGRAHVMLQQGVVDLALTIHQNVNIDSEQLSDIYITYQNVALSLKENSIQLDTLADLKSYSIVGFQNDTIVLGSAYKAAVENSRLHIQLPDQLHQVEMLLLGNTDIVVMDINIFIHLSQQIKGENQLEKVDIHPLFEPSHYSVAFRDLELKVAFNQALADFLESEKHKKLIKKYAFYRSDLSTID